MESHAEIALPPGKRRCRKTNLLRSPVWSVLLLLALSALSLRAVESWRPVVLQPDEITPALPAWLGSSWGRLPQGERELGDVRWNLQGIRRLTGLDAARRGRWFPTRIEGLPVGSRVGVLAVLHGMEGEARPGTPLFSLVFHYEDGRSNTHRFSVGIQTGGMFDGHPVEIRDPATTRLVIPGAGPGGAELFLSRVRNPRPEAKVLRIDLLSLLSVATPVIAGLSVETSEFSVPEFPAAHGSIAKRASAPADHDLRRPLTIRVQADGKEDPIPGAHVYLSIDGDEARYFLDRADTDAQGMATLHFPPAGTLGMHVFVSAPGYQAAVVRQSLQSSPQFQETLSFRLKPGRKAGGLVYSSPGKPLAGARVTITRATSDPVLGLERADHDSVVTGDDGRWASACFPQDLSGFQVTVAHPRFSEQVAQVTAGADSGGAPGSGVLKLPKNAARTAGRIRWTEAELLKGDVATTLKEFPRMPLRVKDESGSPIAGARVSRADGLFGPTVVGEATDGAGQVVLQGAYVGSAPLVVSHPDFAPSVLQPTSLRGDEPAQVTLRKPSTAVIGVQDGAGNPVPGAQVTVLFWGALGVSGLSLVADSSGVCRWSNAAPGSLTLRVSAPRYVRTDSSLEWSGGAMTMRVQRQASLFGRVKDADSGVSVADFSVLRGYSYSQGQPMRWQRGNTIRGRHGEFSAPLYNYGDEARQAFMIEAPGYLPVISPPFRSEGWQTNEFVMKRSRGLAGTVELPDGTPARNTSVVLVDADEWAYIEKNGQITRSSSYADQGKTDGQGRFEFQPRLNVSRLVASQAGGVGEISREEFEKTKVIRLKPWARLEGDLKVEGGLRSHQTLKLETWRPSYYGNADGSRPSAVWTSLKALPDARGHFVFERVAPGTREVFIQSKFSDRRNGPEAVSHGVVVDLMPGTTNHVVVGGSGRKVFGRIQVPGGDPSDVDWLWDVHELQTQPPRPKSFPQPISAANPTPQAAMEAQRRYEQAMRDFQQSPEGNLYERSIRRYALAFKPDGSFSLDNVPAGNYLLQVAPTEKPSDPDSYNYRELGRLTVPVTVKAGKAVNEPLDLGTFDLRIQALIRKGGMAPAFDVAAIDGTQIPWAALRGKVVLLYFWAEWALAPNDIAILKDLAERYENDDRFLLIHLCSQADKARLALLVKQFQMPGRGMAIPVDGSDTVAGLYQVNGWPTALVIGPNGRLEGVQLRGESIRSVVTKAMTRFAQTPPNSSSTPPPARN